MLKTHLSKGIAVKDAPEGISATRIRNLDPNFLISVPFAEIKSGSIPDKANLNAVTSTEVLGLLQLKSIINLGLNFSDWDIYAVRSFATAKASS